MLNTLVHDQPVSMGLQRAVFVPRDVYGPQRPLVENRFVFEGVMDPPLIQMAFS
jgi:hypothetical protein